MEISSLTSTKAKLGCVHLLEPCSPQFSVENSGEGTWGCVSSMRTLGIWVRLPREFGLSVLTSHRAHPAVLQSFSKPWQAIAPWRTICTGRGNAISIFLSLGPESLANTLEPLRWVAVPQTILFHRRRGSHRKSVMYLCPRSPDPICSFSPLLFCHGFPYNFLWALCLGGDWSYCSLADSETETFSFRLILLCSTDRVRGMW